MCSSEHERGLDLEEHVVVSILTLDCDIVCPVWSTLWDLEEEWIGHPLSKGGFLSDREYLVVNW